MTPISSTPPQPGGEGGRIFTAGTLRYTMGGLWVLFAWLMWNDMCIMLMENVAPTLTPLILKDLGATNKEIALFTASLAGMFSVWINPVVSTWSDKFRSRMGRRRPFLLFATPFTAIFLGAIPFMPDIYHGVSNFQLVAHLFAGHERFGPILFVGLCFMAYTIFNSVLLAIFCYYFVDVCPPAVYGRFNSLLKIASNLAAIVWNEFILGKAEAHMKEIFFGLAIFFLVFYTTSLLMVKEGEYPKPEAKPKTNFLVLVVQYFKECFGNSRYLWFIIAMLIFQIGNTSNQFQIFIFRDQLKLSLQTIGHTRSVSMVLVTILAFPIGMMVDLLRPGRVMIASLAGYGLINILGFYYLKDEQSLMIFTCATAVVVTALGISSSVFQLEILGREKFGQLCSAVALTYNFGAGIVGAFLAGVFMDQMKDYRYALLWSAAFFLTSVLIFIKVYFDFRSDQKAGRLPA